MDQVQEVAYGAGDEVEITATIGDNRWYHGARGIIVSNGAIAGSDYLMVRLEIHGEIRDIFVDRLMIKLIKRAPGRGASGAP